MMNGKGSSSAAAALLFGIAALWFTACGSTSISTGAGGSHCGNYASLGIVNIAWEMFQKEALP